MYSSGTFKLLSFLIFCPALLLGQMLPFLRKEMYLRYA